MGDGTKEKVDFEEQFAFEKENSDKLTPGVDGDESLGLLQQQLPTCGGSWMLGRDYNDVLR